MPADGRGRGVRWSVGVGSVAVAGSARLDAQGLGRDAGRSLYVMQVEVMRKSRATAHPRWRDVGVQGGSALPSEPLAKLLGSRLGSVLRFSGVNTPLSWISTACSGPEGPAASQETENKGIDVFSTERGDTGG